MLKNPALMTSEYSLLCNFLCPFDLRHFFYRPTPCYRRICRSRVSLSVTSRCSIETAKRMITQTTLHDTPRLWYSHICAKKGR